jgi:uncharacterized protein
MLLAMAVFAIAILYSMVGHAGASGYIAVMTLFSLAPAEIKPTALALNILVATIGTIQFWRAGHFRWSLFWPFALLSVPLAFIGGAMQLPAQVFKMMLGVVLLYSAWRLFVRPVQDREVREPALRHAIPTGGAIGLMAGLTGTGGGIFLTPLLLFLRWARVKEAAAVSALFILLNSTAGLLGNLAVTRSFPAFAVVLLVAAGSGGTIGSYLGSQRFDPMWIKRALAMVLTIAGGKLLMT